MYNCTNWVTKLWSLTEFWGCNFLLLLKQSIFEFCLSLTHCSRIPRGPVQQTLEDRIFTPTVSAVYSTVSPLGHLSDCVCVFFAHEPFDLIGNVC